MMRTRVFDTYHPAVIFAFFVIAILATMTTLDPVCIAISFTASSAYLIYLRGFRQWAKTLLFFLPMMLLLTSINALFAGLGSTVIGHVFGSSVTVESLAYGIVSSFMLLSTVLWFFCYQEVMETDKFLDLFGGIAPTTAMVISMVLRYVPLMARRASEIDLAQNALIGTQKKGIKQRVQHAARLASVLMGWSMESSIETSNCMHARGYGSTKRSRFTHTHFSSRDAWLLIPLCVLAIGSALMIIRVQGTAYYPMITFMGLPVWGIVIFALTLFFPLVIEGGEALSWVRYSRLKSNQ